MRQFLKYYQIYKDDFDMEMLMRASNTTYAKLKREQEKDDGWEF